MPTRRPFLTTLLAASLLAPVGAGPAGAAEVAPSTATLPALVDAVIARAASVTGTDPAAIAAAIGGAVTPQAYPGEMKGARGAVLSGAANDVDAALLAQALLEAADPSVPTRFATCEHALAITPVDEAGVTRLVDSADDLALHATDLDAATAFLGVSDLRSHALEEVESWSPALAEAIGRSGVTYPVAAAMPGTAATPIHTWLQAELDGAWTDIDPAGDPGGAAPCAPGATSDALDPAGAWQARIAVEAETLRPGGPETTTVLSFDAPLASLAASRIAVAFGEPNGLVERAVEPTAGVPYTPVLRIDGETSAGEPIVLPRIVEGLGASVNEILGTVTDAFGEIGGEPAASPTPEGDPVDGAWVTVTLVPPGGGPAIETRSLLFDRVGAASRGADPATWTLHPLEVVDGEYASLATIWQVGLLVGELAAPGPLLDAIGDPLSVDGLSASLDALLRTYPAVVHDLGGRLAVPAVVLAGIRPVVDAAGESGSSLVLDALHLPADPPADPAGAARDGLAAVVAEHLLASAAGAADGGPAAVTRVLGAAADAGIPFEVYASGTAERPAGASDQALARIDAAIAAGSLVIAPASTPLVDGVDVLAWFALDPATGLVRDEHENGRHTETVEYSGQMPRVVTTADRFRRLGCAIRAPLAIATVAFFLATGGAGHGAAGADASPISEAAGAVTEAMQKKTEDEIAREAADRAANAGGCGAP